MFTAMTDTEPIVEDRSVLTSMFLDELKNEDVQARICVIRRLQSISKSLGFEKTREDLLPMLSEILDDEDDVLLVLAEEIKNLVDAVGGKEYAYLLLVPLELLASADETAVRNKAVEAIKSVAEILPNEHIQAYLVPCIRRLGTGDWFSPRISASNLLAAAYPKVSPEIQAELRVLFNNLCSDDTPMVRRSAFSQLKDFVKLVDREYLDSIIETFKFVAKNEQDSVRLLTVGNCIAIAEMLNEEERDKHILPVVRACAMDKSWRIILFNCYAMLKQK
ncbi:serine/threonine-protein phosphatase PP2A 65 kDa regulatory subunit-like isoform X2 [Schistocerca gregaria]|uniref:serine/threonine-protein phosphatase PP2A 65 kDa regulatory subunit-like isoform X2 n=1 Tax=Schistocerca gregaria TaxID=7010 RepID=UPI00211F40D8|nr:serine/threonine-protein phosphatase PP2A 65 kDa regulatory subunit-like isoform X2 [Schistocerca gregaria]